MLKIYGVLTAVAAAAMLLAPIAARADSSLGQLVYSFTFSSNQDVTSRDSSNPAEAYGAPNPATGGNEPTQSNGISHYNGALSDKGTMTVQILHQQTDGGLVVSISEQGQDIRRAPAAMCVVYGNTNVICDPNKTVYTEEYTLLRFLGSNFVDPTVLGADKHWTITQNGGNHDVTADYTVNGDSNGIMQISETRKIRPRTGGSLTTDVQSKIGYDSKRSVPMSVDEYVTQRHDNGVQGTTTTIFQTTLNLVSDTTAKT
jgi:hypothetical protein